MIEYMIYLIAFILGSVVGLVLSYKRHSEPFVIKGLEPIALIASIIGWILIINFSFVMALLTLGFFLVGYVISERPGYGRGETLIGIVISVIIYIILLML